MLKAVFKAADEPGFVVAAVVIEVKASKAVAQGDNDEDIDEVDVSKPAVDEVDVVVVEQQVLIIVVKSLDFLEFVLMEDNSNDVDEVGDEDDDDEEDEVVCG